MVGEVARRVAIMSYKRTQVFLQIQTLPNLILSYEFYHFFLRTPFHEELRHKITR